MPGSSGVWPFCTECTMTTLPQAAPGTFRLMGTGTALYPGRGGNCPHCRAVVRRHYITFAWIPVVPLARYRVVRDGYSYIGRRMPRERGPATAELVRERARADAAVARAEEELASREARFGNPHRDVLAAQRDVATALLAAGRIADAAHVQDDIAAGWEAQAGPTDLVTLGALDTLVTIHLLAGHVAAMDAAGLQAAGRRRPPDQVDPPLPTLTRHATRDLNTVDATHLDVVKAHAAYIEGCAQRLGPESAGTLRAQHSLAVALVTASRIDEAIRVFEAAFTGRVRTLGPDHPDTADTRRLLLLACADADRRVHDPRHPEFVEAATDARQRVLGPDDPDTLASRIRVGVAYWAEGRRPEALVCWKAALADCERVLGADHPLSQVTLGNLRRALPPSAT